LVDEETTTVAATVTVGMDAEKAERDEDFS
jgi:hypothetical protein